MTKQEEQAKAYRDYREECGVESPTVLDEIEEAFYQGMLKQEEIMMKKILKKIPKSG